MIFADTSGINGDISHTQARINSAFIHEFSENGIPQVKSQIHLNLRGNPAAIHISQQSIQLHLKK